MLSEFFQALWFALIANTDVICYLFIFLNTILSMSTPNLPMSLLVCLWATLTIPRPSKRFWLTIIAYTEVSSLPFSVLFWTEKYKSRTEVTIYFIWSQVMVFGQYFLETISHFHRIEISKHSATFNLILLHLVLFHR